MSEIYVPYLTQYANIEYLPLEARATFNIASLVESVDINNKKKCFEYFIYSIKQITDQFNNFINRAVFISNELQYLKNMVNKLEDTRLRLESFVKYIPTVKDGEYVYSSHFNSVNNCIVPIIDFLGYFFFYKDQVTDEIYKLANYYGINIDTNIVNYLDFIKNNFIILPDGSVEFISFINGVRNVVDRLYYIYINYSSPLIFLKRFENLDAKVNNVQWFYITLFNIILELLSIILFILFNSMFLIINVCAEKCYHNLVILINANGFQFISKYVNPVITRISKSLSDGLRYFEANCCLLYNINKDTLCFDYVENWDHYYFWEFSKGFNCVDISLDDYIYLPVLVDKLNNFEYILYYEDDPNTAVADDFTDVIMYINFSKKMFKVLLNKGWLGHYINFIRYKNNQLFNGYVEYKNPDIDPLAYQIEPSRIFFPYLYKTYTDGTIEVILPNYNELWFISNSNPYYADFYTIFIFKCDYYAGFRYHIKSNMGKVKVVKLSDIEYKFITDGFIKLCLHVLIDYSNKKMYIKVESFSSSINIYGFITPALSKFMYYDGSVTFYETEYTGTNINVIKPSERELLTIYF